MFLMVSQHTAEQTVSRAWRAHTPTSLPLRLGLCVCTTQPILSDYRLPHFPKVTMEYRTTVNIRPVLIYEGQVNLKLFTLFKWH